MRGAAIPVPCARIQPSRPSRHAETIDDVRAARRAETQRVHDHAGAVRLRLRRRERRVGGDLGGQSAEARDDEQAPERRRVGRHADGRPRARRPRRVATEPVTPDRGTGGASADTARALRRDRAAIGLAVGRRSAVRRSGRRARVLRRAPLDELQLKRDGERDVRRNLATIAAPRREKPLTDAPAVRLRPDNPSLKTGLGLRDGDRPRVDRHRGGKGRDRAGPSPCGAARPRRHSRLARRPGIPAARACRSRRSPGEGPARAGGAASRARCRDLVASASNPERTRIRRERIGSPGDRPPPRPRAHALVTACRRTSSPTAPPVRRTSARRNTACPTLGRGLSLPWVSDLVRPKQYCGPRAQPWVPGNDDSGSQCFPHKGAATEPMIVMLLRLRPRPAVALVAALFVASCQEPSSGTDTGVAGSSGTAGHGGSSAAGAAGSAGAGGAAGSGRGGVTGDGGASGASATGGAGGNASGGTGGAAAGASGSSQRGRRERQHER